MQITVGKDIRIEDPSAELYKWARSYLTIDNPDYWKKYNRGLWLGNTPQTLQLYERVGSTLILPFGCLQAIYRMFPESSYKVEFSPLRHFDYDSRIKLYDYQEKAVSEAIKRKNGVLVMPCGGGKTQSGLEIISRVGGRALWLTHTQDLLNQSKERAASVYGCDKTAFGTITGGKVNISEGITFATVQTMAKIDLQKYVHTWDIIVVDECMPGNTLIDTPTGKKELKNLCIDDIITSYNRNERKIENKRITHIFKSKAHDIVKVKLSNGEEIICTENHPIYTRSGRWIAAERLAQNDYVLRLVWEGSRNRYNAPNIKIQGFEARLLLLLKRMFNKWWSQKGCVDGGTQKKNIRNNEKHKQSVSRSVCGENENRQSDEKAGSEKSGIGQAERNWTQTTDKMWKWSWLNSAATKFCNQISRLCERLHRISNTNKNGKKFKLSDLLQSRYSNSRKNDRNRNRWQFTLCGRTAKTGQEKRAVLEWIRVDSVEVQEQTSDGTFGGMCCDGYVYNIEVEDNNNYFANGILVHNCQHCAGSPTRVSQFYKVISSLCARYKIGLTATPYRADGLEQSMYMLLGGVMHEVTREEVEHTTCPVKVVRVETGYAPDMNDITMGDGTIDYAKLINDLTTDRGRCAVVEAVIKGAIDTAQGKTMILGNRVAMLESMCNFLNDKGYNAVCLSALGASKKAKEQRKQALKDLNDGKIDCLLCTYQLASEGLDVPNLKYIVFATPEKNKVTIMQSAGRVARKASNKEFGTIIDFVDDFPMYRNWFQQRLQMYKKMNYEIE